MQDKELLKKFEDRKETWLVTGAAGFIGTNISKTLLGLGQKVIGFDNFSTGREENIKYLQEVAKSAEGSFEFVKGDISDFEQCRSVFDSSIDRVLHNAALGSVPRSIENPLASHNSNVNGFVNMLRAAQQADVKRFVYASSSSVYGDEATLPKVENRVGSPLSPYAATKCMNEVYANVFSQTYGVETIGLRYFNVFGPHQRTDGAYAAVIPKWIGLLMQGEAVTIFGDGETTRDFCFVDNVVQMNIRAAITEDKAAVNQAYNVAHQSQISLNTLYEILRDELADRLDNVSAEQQPIYTDFRAGDINHSLADITKAKTLLGYTPVCDVREGLSQSMDWYIANEKA